MHVSRKRTKMKRTQISLSAEQFEQAKKLALERGVSLSQVVREGLDCVLEREVEDDQHYRDDMMSLIGIVQGANPNSSEIVDEMIYGPDFHR